MLSFAFGMLINAKTYKELECNAVCKTNSSWVCFVFAFFFSFLEKDLMQCGKTESSQFRQLQIALEITKCACTSMTSEPKLSFNHPGFMKELLNLILGQNTSEHPWLIVKELVFEPRCHSVC